MAFSAQGTVGALPASASYTVIVAALDVVTGDVLWTLRDPAWTTTSGDTEPALCLGAAGDLYLAFTTTGTTAGNTNGADAFSFCSPCSGATAGREDVVLARIQQANTLTPSVAWTVQDAYLNSCNRETVPAIAYDASTGRVILVYETNASTLCSAPVGSGSNIVVAAMDAVTGAYVWGYQDALLNSTGSNRAPSVAVDAAGSVYIAYTVTAAVSGGGTLQGVQDVEVVRLRSTGPYTVVRDWIASAAGVWNPGSGATNGAPALLCDPARGRLFLAFTTTAVQTASVSDMVVLRLRTDTGALDWILQSPTYNASPVGAHQSTTALRAAMDSLGQPYIAAAGLDANGDGFTVLLRPDADVGTTDWAWNDPALPFVYETYLAGAAFAAPRQVVQATTTFSVSAMAVRGGCLHAAFIRPDTRTVVVVGLDQVPTFADMSAYTYMDQETAICL